MISLLGPRQVFACFCDAPDSLPVCSAEQRTDLRIAGLIHSVDTRGVIEGGIVAALMLVLFLIGVVVLLLAIRKRKWKFGFFAVLALAFSFVIFFVRAYSGLCLCCNMPG